MKNIHVLPTSKPSRLGYISEIKSYHIFTNGENPNNMADNLASYRNIYITDDSEIKDGDWVIANGGIRFVTRINNDKSKTFTDDGIISKQSPSSCCHLKHYKKIILTTDETLIKSGVQAIDDEFLEWFVKNSSCESVEVVHHEVSLVIDDTIYKIIIPQEESKQETLEEVCDKVLNYLYPNCKKEMSNLQYTNAIMSLKYIAEWQAERMYSQYEVNEIIAETWLSVEDNEGDETFSQARERILEEFKKTKDGI